MEATSAASAASAASLAGWSGLVVAGLRLSVGFGPQTGGFRSSQPNFGVWAKHPSASEAAHAPPSHGRRSGSWAAGLASPGVHAGLSMSASSVLKSEEATAATAGASPVGARSSGGGQASDGGRGSEASRASRSPELARSDSKKLERTGSPNFARRRSLSDMSLDSMPPPPVSHVFVSNKEYLVNETEALSAAATAEEAKQAQLRESLSLGAKLAAKTKGTRAADLLKKWDLKGDGVVSRGELRQNIKNLGIEATEEETDELFEVLDADRSQSLEIGELRITVPRLLEISA